MHFEPPYKEFECEKCGEIFPEFDMKVFKTETEERVYCQECYDKVILEGGDKGG